MKRKTKKRTGVGVQRLVFLDVLESRMFQPIVLVPTPTIRVLRPRKEPMENKTTSGAKVLCIALLDCPFCGGKARYAEHEGGEWVECAECTASTVCMYPNKEDVKELLAERWNARR
jgi:hypothetical protein